MRQDTARYHVFTLIWLIDCIGFYTVSTTFQQITTATFNKRWSCMKFWNFLWGFSRAYSSLKSIETVVHGKGGVVNLDMEHHLSSHLTTIKKYLQIYYKMTIIYTQYVIIIYIFLYAQFIGFLIRTYTLDLNNWNNGFIFCRGFCTSFVTNTWYVTGCDVYTYGLDCKRCGTCRGGVQCDHVTGTCPNGCYPGMYGNECDRGNFRITFAFSKK